jgi:hypothetical protein
LLVAEYDIDTLEPALKFTILPDPIFALNVSAVCNFQWL